MSRRIRAEELVAEELVAEELGLLTATKHPSTFLTHTHCRRLSPPLLSLGIVPKQVPDLTRTGVTRNVAAARGTGVPPVKDREGLPHQSPCCERVSRNRPVSRASGCPHGRNGRAKGTCA